MHIEKETKKVEKLPWMFREMAAYFHFGFSSLFGRKHATANISCVTWIARRALRPHLYGKTCPGSFSDPRKKHLNPLPRPIHPVFLYYTSLFWIS